MLLQLCCFAIVCAIMRADDKQNLLPGWQHAQSLVMMTWLPALHLLHQDRSPTDYVAESVQCDP